jgi:hypothetical protein
MYIQKKRLQKRFLRWRKVQLYKKKCKGSAGTGDG